MASSILIPLLLLGLAVICNVQGYYRIKPKKPEGHFNESLALICSFKKSNPHGKSFSWFRGETIITDKTSGYSIATKSDKTILTIKNLHLNDENEAYWFGTYEENDIAYRPCDFPTIKIFPKITTERFDEKLTAEQITIRRDNGASVHLTCRLTSHIDSSLIPKWEFSPENDEFHDLPSAILVQDNDLIIKSVEKQHRGYYRCSFENRNEKSKVLLRMKNRYAAWWPFVGIVIVVVICVTVVLAIEKRRKVAQKAAASAAAKDKTSEPLILQTSRIATDVVA